MSRRKLTRDDRRLLKRAGFGREMAGMGALAVALDEATHGARPDGYAQRPDSSWGERTRRRVARNRRRRVWARVRYALLMVGLYAGSALLVLLLLAGVFRAFFSV